MYTELKTCQKWVRTAFQRRHSCLLPTMSQNYLPRRPRPEPAAWQGGIRASYWGVAAVRQGSLARNISSIQSMSDKFPWINSIFLMKKKWHYITKVCHQFHCDWSFRYCAFFCNLFVHVVNIKLSNLYVNQTCTCKIARISSRKKTNSYKVSHWCALNISIIWTDN